MKTHLVNHLLDREESSDQRIAFKLDAELLQVVDLGVDHLVGQTEIRNAVLQNAARLVKGLVHRDVATGLGHVGGAGHAGRAGANNADPKAVRLDVRNIDPALLDGGVADKALHAPDGHRFKRVAHGADTFALVFLRADAPADRRQQIGVGQNVIGAAKILFADFLDEARDIDAHRAARDAGLVRAHQAAVGFAQRFFEVVAASHLLEIGCAHLGVKLAHRRAFLRNRAYCLFLGHLFVL